MMRIMMIRRVVMAASLLWTIAGCTPQQALLSSLIPDGTTSVLLSHLQSEPDANRKQVVAMEARKDWEGLIKLAEQNLARERRIAGWWFVAGYANAQAGHHLKAIECFNELALLAPDDIEGWELLAQEYLAAGQPQRAVQTLGNALRVRDDSPTTWVLLGQGYEDLTRPDLAVGAYRSALKLNGQIARAWLGLGRASARLNRQPDYEQALKALEKLDPAMAKQLAEMRPAGR
jgi:tetratricopeptide (TPR) repeat protein